MTMTPLTKIARGARKIADGTTERDRGIVEARVDGFAWERIAESADLTPMGAQKIARRLNGGTLPVPRQREVAQEPVAV
jgi:hypothetical protein